MSKISWKTKYLIRRVETLPVLFKRRDEIREMFHRAYTRIGRKKA